MAWKPWLWSMLAAAALPAMAQDAPGRRLDTATSGGLTVVQFAYTDPQAVLQAWTNPGPTGVQLKTDSRGYRDKPIYTFVIFRGCRADAMGNCTLTADFDVEDPTGKPYVQQKSVRTWVGKPPAPAPNYTLATGYLGLVVEHKDMTGPYRVRMTLTDQIAGVTLHTEQTLSIAE